MDVNQIARIVQIYTMQNLYAGSGQGSDMFQMVLDSVMDKVFEENGINSSLGDELSQKVKAFEGNGVNSNLGNELSLRGIIDEVARRYNVDGDLVKSVVKQESAFNPEALSRCGAMGLMQLMPKTAESLNVKNPFDALDNIDGGTRYLKGLLDTFKGSKELALAAYNGGIGRMKKLGVDSVDEISKMPLETRSYVSNVIKNYNKYKVE